MANQGLMDLPTDQLESNYGKTNTTFDEMSLNSELLCSVYEYGLEGPSSVQQRAIMPMIEGKDIILEAPPATGKTLALCISALQTVDPDIKSCQALIIAPTVDKTREIHNMIIKIGHFAQIKCLTIDRSFSINDDTSKLYNGEQFIVGTPGRLLQLIQRGPLPMESIKLFMLDEADETFARGFAEHILALHHLLPKSPQVVFSSITMADEETIGTANKLMRNPFHITIKRTTLHLGSIKRFYTLVEDDASKLDILSHLSATLGDAQAIIFCNTRKKVEWLANELQLRGISAAMMHGDMDAWYRADIMKEVQSGSSRLLLATNMLARGIDKQHFEVVVNFEVPAEVEEYKHRTSYDPRCVRECVNINLVGPGEVERVREIERHYGTPMEEVEVVEVKRMFDFRRGISEATPEREVPEGNSQRT